MGVLTDEYHGLPSTSWRLSPLIAITIGDYHHWWLPWVIKNIWCCVSWLMGKYTFIVVAWQWVPMGDENRLHQKTSMRDDTHWVVVSTVDGYHGWWEPLGDGYLMAIILEHHQWWVAMWVFHGHWMESGWPLDGYCVYEEWESWSTLVFSDYLLHSLTLSECHTDPWSRWHLISMSHGRMVFLTHTHGLRDTWSYDHSLIISQLCVSESQSLCVWVTWFS